MNIKEITPHIAAMYLGQTADHKSPVGGFASVRDIDTVTISDLQCGIVIITPHLRRLESITEAEARDVYEVAEGIKWTRVHNCISHYWLDYEEDYWKGVDRATGNPAAWLHLLSKGFDLFGLIDAGLAKETAP